MVKLLLDGGAQSHGQKQIGWLGKDPSALMNNDTCLDGLVQLVRAPVKGRRLRRREGVWRQAGVAERNNGRRVAEGGQVGVGVGWRGRGRRGGVARLVGRQGRHCRRVGRDPMLGRPDERGA